MKPLPGRWCLLLLLLCLRTAFAHEGHDHEAAAAPAPAAELEAPPLPGAAADAPRLALSGEHLELVALRDAGGLLVYTDDYSSNAPLSGLRVALRSGTHSLQAAPDGEGRYRIPAGLLPEDQALPLQFIVQAESWSEQLHGVLPAGQAARQPVAHATAAWWWLLLLPLLALLLWHRKRRGLPA